MMMEKSRKRLSLAIIGCALIFIGWQGYLIDQQYQARVVAEKQAEIENERLRLVVYSAPVAIVMCGPDRTIVLCSPSAGRLFGYEPEELIGKDIDIILPENLRKRHQVVFDEAVEKMRNLDGDWIISKSGIDGLALHKDGSEIPIKLTIRLIKYGDEVEVISSMRRVNEDNVQSVKIHSSPRYEVPQLTPQIKK